jgi:hypothetical protein
MFQKSLNIWFQDEQILQNKHYSIPLYQVLIQTVIRFQTKKTNEDLTPESPEALFFRSGTHFGTNSGKTSTNVSGIPIFSILNQLSRARSRLKILLIAPNRRQNRITLS